MEPTGQANGRRNQKQPNPFIGAVVTAPVVTMGRQVNAVSVIDGQQRLTTLQVVLTALRAVSARWEAAGMDAAFHRLTRNNNRTDQAYEQLSRPAIR